MSLLNKIKKENIPAHIAIIMDGNGRWAKVRGLSRAEGHREGVISVRKVVEAGKNVNVRYLTMYAFSNENWSRPQSEVDALMELMVYAITKELPDLIKNGVKLHAIGDIGRLPEKTRITLQQSIIETAAGKNITLVLALSYSSQWEIVHATKKITEMCTQKKLSTEEIDEAVFSDFLTTRGIPNPDLLIRTGGEKRISNFLLWQSAYAELYFTDTFWPDFREEEFYEAIVDYQQRERRFGKTSEQIERKS